MTRTVFLVLGVFAAGSASAVPIDGFVGFGGTWDRTGNTLNFPTATVETVGGDLDPFININDGTSFTSFTFDPFSGAVTLWTLGGFTFELVSLSSVSDSGTHVDLFGTGELSGNGFDPTPTTWDFSSNELTFSTANITQVPVPEPGVLSLFGLGLLATVFVARRRRTS